jgi:hypothetical protein
VPGAIEQEILRGTSMNENEKEAIRSICIRLLPRLRQLYPEHAEEIAGLKMHFWKILIEERTRRMLRAGEHESKTTAAANAPSNSVIIRLGEREYRIGDAEPITVSDNEDSVLQAFLRQASMDGPALVENAGFERAPKVLRDLKVNYDGIFGPAIRMPGKKGKGGYHVAIRSS